MGFPAFSVTSTNYKTALLGCTTLYVNNVPFHIWFKDVMEKIKHQSYNSTNDSIYFEFTLEIYSIIVSGLTSISTLITDKIVPVLSNLGVSFNSSLTLNGYLQTQSFTVNKITTTAGHTICSLTAPNLGTTSTLTALQLGKSNTTNNCGVLDYVGLSIPYIQLSMKNASNDTALRIYPSSSNISIFPGLKFKSTNTTLLPTKRIPVNTSIIPISTTFNIKDDPSYIRIPFTITTVSPYFTPCIRFGSDAGWVSGTSNLLGSITSYTQNAFAGSYNRRFNGTNGYIEITPEASFATQAGSYSGVLELFKFNMSLPQVWSIRLSATQTGSHTSKCMFEASGILYMSPLYNSLTRIQIFVAENTSSIASPSNSNFFATLTYS